MLVDVGSPWLIRPCHTPGMTIEIITVGLKRDGWRFAGLVVPIAYIAWSIWLIVLGVFLLI